MSFFTKLAFWKKEPELDLKEDDLGKKDLGSVFGGGDDLKGFPTDSLNPIQGQENEPFHLESFQQHKDFQTQYPFNPSNTEIRFKQEQQGLVSKDIEILSAKIDSLKAMLESINQRLANLERIASEENKSSYGYGYRRIQW